MHWTEFPFLKPGSFEMRGKKKSDVIILEETGEWSGTEDVCGDHSVGWKESWRLDAGLRLRPHAPIPAHLVNVFKLSTPASPHIHFI